MIKNKLSWLKYFIAFGIFGTVGEASIGALQEYIFRRPLWVYYNGFYTSIESFFYFGFFGCVGFKLWWLYNSRKVKHHET